MLDAAPAKARALAPDAVARFLDAIVPVAT